MHGESDLIGVSSSHHEDDDKGEKKKGEGEEERENPLRRSQSPLPIISEGRPASAADILCVSVQTWLTCLAHPTLASVSCPPAKPEFL